MENDLKKEIVTDKSLESIKVIETLLKKLQTNLMVLAKLNSFEKNNDEHEKLSVEVLEISYFLENTLDHKHGGEIARNLQALYQHIRFAVLRAKENEDISFLKSAESVIKEINKGWSKLITVAA